MPFTVSHIAAVLPFHRPLRRLGLFSAAAIGAMTPDLDLILPLRLTRQQTHGWLALFTFCLPVGLGAWALFQLLIKPAMVEVLPDRIFLRLQQDHSGPRLGNWRTWLWAALALLLGALSHIVWDGFTHEDGRGVRMLPFLEDFGPGLGNRPMHLYRWLQHGSSVVGLLIVFIAVWLWVRHAQRILGPVERRLAARERYFWTIVYLVIPIAFVGATVFKMHHAGWPRLASTVALTRIAITAILSSALSLIITSALIRRRVVWLEARKAPPEL